MNDPSATKVSAVSEHGEHLLDAIRTIRSEVGDGLSDDEFTRLLQQMDLPGGVGLRISVLLWLGFVTLKVPRSNRKAGYF